MQTSELDANAHSGISGPVFYSVSSQSHDTQRL